MKTNNFLMGLFILTSICLTQLHASTEENLGSFAECGSKKASNLVGINFTESQISPKKALPSTVVAARNATFLSWNPSLNADIVIRPNADHKY